jgi:hypothetical protein
VPEFLGFPALVFVIAIAAVVLKGKIGIVIIEKLKLFKWYEDWDQKYYPCVLSYLKINFVIF